MFSEDSKRKFTVFTKSDVISIKLKLLKDSNICGSSFAVFVQA